MSYAPKCWHNVKNLWDHRKIQIEWFPEFRKPLYSEGLCYVSAFRDFPSRFQLNVTIFRDCRPSLLSQLNKDCTPGLGGKQSRFSTSISLGPAPHILLFTHYIFFERAFNIHRQSNILCGWRFAYLLLRIQFNCSVSELNCASLWSNLSQLHFLSAWSSCDYRKVHQPIASLRGDILCHRFLFRRITSTGFFYTVRKATEHERPGHWLYAMSQITSAYFAYKSSRT